VVFAGSVWYQHLGTQHLWRKLRRSASILCARRAAEHDFGGHRVKAIAHPDRAMREAEIRMSMR